MQTSESEQIQLNQNKSNKKINNETIGQTAEAALCNVANISCSIDASRINLDIKKKIEDKLSLDNITSRLSSPIKSSVGYKNDSVDFILENGEKLSLKTLKNNTGKICPQNTGQPTYKSWDNKFNHSSWEGKKVHNPDRWVWIKQNIHQHLNLQLKNTFCCDWLILIKNCNHQNMDIKLYSKKDLEDKLNYFTNQTIYFTRDEYEEKWNEKKQKYSEFSSCVKFNHNDEPVTIGEFQFHKSSRQQVKFRFFEKFLNIV